MPLKPSEYKPNYGPPDGVYLVMFEDAKAHKQDGSPYETDDGFRQIAFKVSTQDGKKLTKYLTLGEEKADLLRTLQAFEVPDEALEGLEWADFLDVGNWYRFFTGRTAEATVKTVENKKTGKTFTATYFNKIGTAEAKAAQAAQTAPPPAPKPAPVRAAPPPVQRPAAAPQPNRWGAGPANPVPPRPPIKQTQPADDVPYDDPNGPPF